MHSRILSDVVHERDPDLLKVLRQQILHQLSEEDEGGNDSPAVQTTRVCIA